MEKQAPNRLSECIRQVVSTLQLPAETDQELLQRFVGHRDEAAFAAVVRRHGPMVLRVALRTLQSEPDAEDVFQATFLVLSQKAQSLRRQESLGSWLYGIAYRLALKTKTTASERRNRHRRIPAPTVATPLAQITVQEAQTILDDEISRLPEKLREPVVLCCLEGLARDEAARQIGCPASVLKSRLEQGRERLRHRLITRGLSLPCSLGAFLLLESAVGAALPPALIGATTKAAIAVAAGKAANTVVAAKVAALSEGVLRTMLLTKIKIAAVALVAGMMLLGGGMLKYRTLAAQGDKRPSAEEQPTTPQRRQPAKHVEADQEAKALEGEWAVIAIETAGEKALGNDVRGMKWVFQGNIVTCTNADGSGGKMSFRLDAARSPKEIDIISLDGPSKGKTAAGIYALEGRRLRVCLSEKGRPREFASDLGIITLEKQDLTAWGKEVGGLQAGLGFRPGERRAYHHGETVTLVIRVRNVGKETVKFSYLQPYIEHSPIVIDGDGKAVPQIDSARLYEIGSRLPAEKELAPGKEIELHQLKRELKPASESGLNQARLEGRPHALFGTGRVRVQYEQVFGDPAMGRTGWKLDPVLGKLATGKLELEIKNPIGLPGAANQGDERQAEKLFGTFEKKLAAAKAVRIALEGTAVGIEDVPGAIKYKGTMVITEGNKAHFEMEVEIEGKNQKSKLVSDGAKMLGHLVEGNGLPTVTPKKFFEEMIGFFKHGGPVVGHVLSSSSAEGGRSVATFKASAFKLGKKETIGKREAQVIDYKLVLENAPEEAAEASFSERLWLDVETNLPLKRVFTGKLKKEFTCTENYSEFTLNPKVDAKLFELSKILLKSEKEEVAAREHSANNLKEIGLAMHNIHGQTQSLPARAIYGKEGKTPLLSWRVTILPHIGHTKLYQEFKLDEPWDSAHNKKLIPKMPKLYAMAGATDAKEGATFYQVVFGPGTLFDGSKTMRFQDITDGTSNTLLVVEAKAPVVWTKPDDLQIPKDKDTRLPVGGLFTDGFNVLLCEATVRFVPHDVPVATFRALITPAARD